MSDLQYTEQTTTGGVADVVRCVWSLRGKATGDAPEPIISDGCVEIVFHFGDLFEQTSGEGQTRPQPRFLIVGPTARPTVVQPTGRIDAIGIRLQPWAARAMTGVAADELRDQILPFDDVMPKCWRSLPDDIADEAVADRRFEELLRLLAKTPVRAPDPAARSLLTIAARFDAVPTVRGLAREAGRSVRTVERLFASEVGLSPKTCQRIARVQLALALARRQPHLRWAAIAARAGYHDQSHFLRDFRRLAGCLPTDLRADDASLTGAFLER